MNQRIELRDVSKNYRVFGIRHRASLGLGLPSFGAQRRVAVERVSLTIEPGERVGIVGRNGAGKTTLLKLLAGLARPTSGDIIVHGRVTAIMTLGLGIREDLTGRENIYVEGEMQGRRRADVDRVIDNVIDFADLGPFIDYPVRTYSTGMKARLAFATATHVEPEILIIDEALSVGDVTFATKATRKMRQLCETGKIVVIVSHSMRSVIDICNRCLWMDNGRIVMDGDPSDVTEAYVEAIHRDEDRALLARFPYLVTSHSLRPGCEITALTVAQEGEEDRAVLAAGLDTSVRWSISTADRLRQPSARFEIVRLDGLVVSDSTVPLGGAAAAASEDVISYVIGMQPLVLGPGVYQFRIGVCDGSELVAERSSIVEVITAEPPRGGRTTLVYPCAVTAKLTS